MSLDKKLAAKAASRWGSAPAPIAPVYPHEGEPALRSAPRPRKRTGYIDTPVYPETRDLLNRMIDTIRMRGNRKITQSELLERAIAALAREEGIS